MGKLMATFAATLTIVVASACATDNPSKTPATSKSTSPVPLTVKAGDDPEDSYQGTLPEDAYPNYPDITGGFCDGTGVEFDLAGQHYTFDCVNGTYQRRP